MADGEALPSWILKYGGIIYSSDTTVDERAEQHDTSEEESGAIAKFRITDACGGHLHHRVFIDRVAILTTAGLFNLDAKYVCVFAEALVVVLANGADGEDANLNVAPMSHNDWGGLATVINHFASTSAALLEYQWKSSYPER